MLLKCFPFAGLGAAAEVGWDGTVEELQALVASLNMAVEFAQALTGAMVLLTQLLASSTASDVQVGSRILWQRVLWQSMALGCVWREAWTASEPQLTHPLLGLTCGKHCKLPGDTHRDYAI